MQEVAGVLAPNRRVAMVGDGLSHVQHVQDQRSDALDFRICDDRQALGRRGSLGGGAW